MEAPVVNNGILSSSDYSIRAIDIITSDGKAVNISKMFINFNLYENIFSPYVSGDLTVSDAADLISTFALHGNEYLYLEMDKPSLDEPIKKYFRIYKISDRTYETQSLQQYKLYFCSEELLLSTQKYVKKSYRGVGIDIMIKDVLKTHLKVHDDKIKNGKFSPTAANFDIIVPRMQPLEAALWLTTRAYNDSQTLYFFYENRDGYNFCSYEDLIKQTPYAKYTRAPKVTQDPSQNESSINYIKIITDFDVVKGNRYGQYSTSMLTFDILNREYRITSLNAENLNPSSYINKHLPANRSLDRFGSSLFDNIESMQKFYVFVDSDKNKNPIKPENWILNTAMKMSQLNSLKIVLNVPTDFLLTVGQVIELRLPRMQPQDKTFIADEYKSGKYLITSVHHGVTGDVSSTTLELLSDSYGNRLPSSVDLSGELQDVKLK